MKISELDVAKKITIDEGFLNIVIDKINHKILYTQKSKDTEDITQKCEQMEKEYTIGDIVVDTPYKLGQVCSKVLNNRIDRKCINWLNECNLVIE